MGDQKEKKDMEPFMNFVKTIAPSISMVISHLIDYEKNVQAFNQEVQNLKNTRAALQMRVQKAEKNGEFILPDVESWISRADKSIKEAETFLKEEEKENAKCLYGWCCVVCRYCRSSSAKQKTEDLKELRADGTFWKVSVLGPTGEMESTTIENSKEPKPRKHIEEEVMAALEDPEVNIIGICGLLGVGKTKLAQEVGKWAKEKKLFDEVITVVVSQKPDLKKMQCEVAEPLGMKLTEETPPLRVERLRDRLMKTKKGVLIILDDIWKRLDLKELGIFSFGEVQRSKIMLTSRNRRVCSDMGAEIFIVEPLFYMEARSLFAGMAGISIEDLERDPVKKSVADECNCLPRLLVIVGSALKNKSKPVWEDACLQLKRRNFETLPEVCVDVYQPLVSRYNNLKSQEAKKLFSLCHLLPRDNRISIDDLVIYGMGLNLFGGIESFMEAKNRVCALVETLKDDFLLVDSGWSTSTAIMVDVVSVAMSIASKDVHDGFLIGSDVNLKKLPTYAHSTAMSIILHESTEPELPPMLKCPRLEILLLICMKYSSEVLQDNFFKALEKLKVLDMRQRQIATLPSSLGLLTSLQTLRIMSNGSRSIKNISVVGKLVNLENLSFSDTAMEVLPEEIGHLKKLRFLELRSCVRLRTIPPGLIAGLHGLEALSMKDMYEFRWEVEEDGNKRSNASLKDLESLPKLTTLQIGLGALELIPRSLCLCSKLTGYAISIGANVYYEGLDWQKFMDLTLPTIITFSDWVGKLIKESEVLWLNSYGSKSVVDELNLNGFLHLKELRIGKCGKLEYLTNAVHGRPPSGIVAFPILNTLHLTDLAELIGVCGDQLPAAGSFRELKELWLHRLPSLTHLWKCPTQNVCLGNLKLVDIDYCRSLRSLLSLSIVSGAVQLEKLYIRNCGKLIEVFSDESGDGNVTSEIKFPKLKEIQLENLKKLIRFCGRIDCIEFPQLNHLRVGDLPLMKEFCPKSYNDNTRELRSFFNQKPVFGSLKWLQLENLQHLRYLFYPSMARALLHLRQLTILNCQAMEEVVLKEEVVVKEESQQKKKKKEKKVAKEEKKAEDEILFPQLEYLLLVDLPKLRSIFQVKHGLDLPSLNQLRVNRCPILKAFSLGTLSTPKLKAVESDYGDFGVDDLNTTITHIYEKEKLDSRKLLRYHELQNVTEIWGSKIQTSSFSILEVLEVESCNNLRRLFYPSMARALMQLQRLIIVNCQAMEVVVEKEEKEAEDEMRTNEILFPQLEYLALEYLPNLRSFFQVKHGLDLPSLNVLRVAGCLELQAFSLGSLSAPNLKAVESGNGDVWVHDLNTTIRHMYENPKEYVEASDGEVSEAEAIEANIAEGFEYVPPSLEDSSTEPFILDKSSQSSKQGPLVHPKPKQAKPKLNVHQMTNLESIKYLTQFPEVIRPFIASVKDVPGDGHCGFRVVAKFMDLEDDGWKKVREDLLNEMQTFETDCLRVFSKNHVDELKHSIQCWDATVDREHWLIMPDMGHLIASCYNIVVVLISSRQCLTFLPLRQQAPPETSHRILGIGYINENHFAVLKFKPDSPLPPVSNLWNDHHNELAKGWITPYVKRIEKFQAMLGNDTNVATVEKPDDIA